MTTKTTRTGIARAETVGSLLRPEALRAARAAVAAGEGSAEQVRAAEDDAVRAAIALQEAVGLDVISDGELRRLAWNATIPFAEEPFFRPPVAGYRFFPDDKGWVRGWRGVDGQRVQRPARPRPIITEPLSVARDIVADEYAFLKEHAHGRTKFTFPSPSYHRVFWHPEHSKAVYPTIDHFLRAVLDYTRAQVIEPLLRLGCDYIQLDAPNYGQFYTDADLRAEYEAEGHNLAANLIADVEIDNAVFDGISGITRALHVCRGNGPGGIWSATGGYDHLAPVMFPRLTNVDTLLLEYDTPRSGDFRPLGHVRPHQAVVLGLLTTKHGALEDAGLVEQRITEAARYVPLDRLALSPQCGFNSAGIGNPLDEAEQEAKLRRVVEVARRVWG